MYPRFSLCNLAIVKNGNMKKQVGTISRLYSKNPFNKHYHGRSFRFVYAFINLYGVGTAVYMIADKNMEQSVFDIMILHKAELQDFRLMKMFLTLTSPFSQVMFTAFIRITKIVFLQRETIVYQVPDVRAIWHTQNINMILI